MNIFIVNDYNSQSYICRVFYINVQCILLLLQLGSSKKTKRLESIVGK